IEERAYVGSDAAVVGVAVPLLRALQYAHAGRTIHARLTPYCVFLPPGGGVKVEGLGPPRPADAALGFGIHATVDANRMSRGGETHTAMSTVGGHRLYSARRTVVLPSVPPAA